MQSSFGHLTCHKLMQLKIYGYKILIIYFLFTKFSKLSSYIKSTIETF